MYLGRKSLKLIIGLMMLYFIGWQSVNLLTPHPEDRSQVDYIPIRTVDELEALSDAVVLVTVSWEKRQQSSPDDSYPALWTVTTARVEQVYHGSLLPGQEIEILEPYGYYQDSGRLIFRADGHYMPLRPQAQYLLFTRETSLGGYACWVLGKHVLPRPRELKAETLEVYQLQQIYLRLYQLVMEKYTPIISEQNTP